MIYPVNFVGASPILFIVLFFCLVRSSLYAGEVELFCDWLWHAKGQEIFPLQEETPIENLSFHSYFRRKLRERGDDVKSWEVEKYRPWLLKWSGVSSFLDFKHWLGFDLPKKEVMDPNTKYWIFWSLGPKLKDYDFSSLPKEKLVLIMFEPPTVQEEVYDKNVQDCFGTIFTWDDDLVDGKKFLKFYYPVLEKRRAVIPPFGEKKFCVMVATRLTSHHPKELYSERKKIIEFFETKPDGEFDLYGRFWKKKNKTAYKSWRGELLDVKLETIKNYKFYICYENTKDVRGYVTEKIFHCLAAGVIPIYLGASNITDYVPKECFIDRREFTSDEELYQFLKKMTEEEYETYQRAAKAYLESDRAKLFSVGHFVSTLLDVL